MKYTGLTGQLVLPGNPGYDWTRQEYNKAINKYPCAIVYCCNSSDITNAIIWSRKQGVKLRIRSGRHNYEDYSNGDGKLVIDTTLMKNIKVNFDDDTVDVQAGTRLGDLYEKLYKCGYTFPGGTCTTVGLSGLVLGGGIGLSTRYLGLTSDSLLEAEMIDAEGNLLTVNDCCNQELFWALRGAGGGNFGVVTRYKFQLKNVDKITLIQLRWDNNMPARLEFLRVWQEWLPHLDRRISGLGGIYKSGAWMNSFFYGCPEEAKQILAPLLEIPGITLKNIEYVDFIEAVRKIGASYPKREAFKATGRFVQRNFSQSELMKIIGIVDKAPTDSKNSSIQVYSLGGAVRDLEANSTAFFDRQADYIIAIASSWESEKEALLHKKWVAAGFDYICTLTLGSYINFPYDNLPNYEQAYYGEHIRRLRCIKRDYDPNNIFSFSQSIKVSR